MHSKYSKLVVVTGLILVLVSVVIAQDLRTFAYEKLLTTNDWHEWVTNNQERVLFENGPLRIFCSDNFPENMASEIHVGARLFPHFSVEGKTNQLKSLCINHRVGESVSILRKQTKEESYLLFLFTRDEDGKIMSLFDLNIDGIWDVKQSPTLGKRYIFENRWLEVDKIEGRNSEKPTAIKGKEHYQFQKTWKLAQQ